MELILASQSPRRREMLGWLGWSFSAVSTQVDESPRTGETPEALVTRLARSKALAVNAAPEIGVLAADTLVVLDGQALGKPRDANEARAMLLALRGREHAVLTALSLRYDGRLFSRVVQARVWMRDYTRDEIEAYIASGDPFDKAGAYAIQHPLFRPVERIEVCYATVVGFPFCAWLALLRTATGDAPTLSVPALCQRHFGYTCPQVDEGREA